MEPIEARRKVTLIFSIDEPIVYLKSRSIKNEDPIFYEAVVQNLVDCLLDHEDHRGEKHDGWEVAEEMLTNHYMDKGKAFQMCNEVMDQCNKVIAVYLPDLDGTRFCQAHSLTHEIRGETLEITLHDQPDFGHITQR